MPSDNNQTNPYLPHRAWLLQIARQSLIFGVQNGIAPPVPLEGLADILQQNGATFVTLEINGSLRGCVGRLEASQPLAIDAAENTVAAAIKDPRFDPVTLSEVESISLSISILTKPEPMHVQSELDLQTALRPGIDGLILQEGFRRATFLPSVWDELPNAGDFIRHLKQKAGWPIDYWSDQISVSRYQTFYFSETEPI